MVWRLRRFGFHGIWTLQDPMKSLTNQSSSALIFPLTKWKWKNSLVSNDYKGRLLNSWVFLNSLCTLSSWLVKAGWVAWRSFESTSKAQRWHISVRDTQKSDGHGNPGKRVKLLPWGTITDGSKAREPLGVQTTGGVKLDPTFLGQGRTSDVLKSFFLLTEGSISVC